MLNPIEVVFLIFLLFETIPHYSYTWRHHEAKKIHKSSFLRIQILFMSGLFDKWLSIDVSSVSVNLSVLIQLSV